MKPTGKNLCAPGQQPLTIKPTKHLKGEKHQFTPLKVPPQYQARTAGPEATYQASIEAQLIKLLNSHDLFDPIEGEAWTDSEKQSLINDLLRWRRA